MLPEKHPLIDSITRPLDDNAELKLSASQILREKFDPDHSSVPEMLERLAKEDKKKFPALGKIVLWVLTVLLLIFAIYLDHRSIIAVAKVHDLEPLEEFELSPKSIKYTEAQQLLLDDPEIEDLTEKKRLFESDPTNPAYYAEYVIYYELVHEAFPTDFYATIERIDPENSFFLYWAAAVKGHLSVERKSAGGSRAPKRIVDGIELRPLPSEMEYTIRDQAAYDEALELFRRASELPEFRTYTNEMILRRGRFIPTVNYENYERGYDFFEETSGCGVPQIFRLSYVLAARAEELSKNGREEEFVNFSEQCRKMLAGMAKNDDVSAPGEFYYQLMTYMIGVNFSSGAERLGLKEIKESYQKLVDYYVAEKDLVTIRSEKGIETFPSDRASSLGMYLDLYVYHANTAWSPIDDSYLKPMRLVEHELLGRFGVLAVSLVLLIGAFFVFLLRFLAPTAIRLPSMRIAGLLKFSDWIWIFILGIALPILVFLFISRLSPVSGRDYSCSHFEFAFPGVHLIALLLTLLLAPAIVTRWRLTRHAAAFKFGSRLDLLSLPVIVVMLVYAIIAYPVLTYFRLNDLVEFAFMLPPLGWLAFVFFNGLRIFLGSARTRLIQTSTAIAVLPAYAMAILALCLTLPIYISAERQGLKAGKNIFIDPVTSELGAYEFKVAAQKRKEINAILGIE